MIPQRITPSNVNKIEAERRLLTNLLKYRQSGKTKSIQTLDEYNKRTNKSMKFTEYQRLAKTTAIYPESVKITYPALGLAGETGEVCEKIKKMLRDESGVLSDEKRLAIKKELGDVCWYIANLACDLDLDLGEIAQENLDKLFDRKERGVIKGDGDNR